MASRKRRTTKKNRPRRKRRGCLLPACGLLALAAGALFLFYAVLASRYDLKDVEKIPERSAVYDMDGRFYTRLAGDNRVLAGYDAISPLFIKALLAREDSRFYKHPGVDPIGIARAMVRNVSHGRIREGGSTITQQLALNTFLGGHHTHSLHRKLLEAVIALRIEENFTKRQVLEFYANRIYFGTGLYGVETASQSYFGKAAAKLTAGEAAMLAGMIRSPNRYSPWRNPKGAMEQRDSVLDRMVQLGTLAADDAAAAKRAKVKLAPRLHGSLQENYALETVRGDLDMILGEEQMDEGGIRIFTTIDPALQGSMDAAIEKNLREIEHRDGYSHPRRGEAAALAFEDEVPVTRYLQGSAIAIDNRTGGIRAIAGGRNYAESRYNRAVLSARQVGSTFKPFVYAAAFAAGLKAGSPVDDSPIRRGEVKAAPGWSPGNSDGTNRGTLPAQDGLILSRNTMTVRVGETAGLDQVRRTAAAAGLGDLPAFPSIYLGSFEASLKDMTAACTVFPNEGVRRQPYIIERIEDTDGQVIYRAAHVQARVLGADVCRAINGVLAQVLTRGTASSARSLGLKKAAAGKTGTTDDFCDAWFIGYTRSLTCGVWVGLDKPRTIISRGYGSTLALPIWVDVLNAASPRRYPSEAFPSAAPQETPKEELKNLWRRLFGR